MDKKTFIEMVKHDLSQWEALLAQIDPGQIGRGFSNPLITLLHH